MVLKKGRSRSTGPSKRTKDPWLFRFPNAADFNFNYWKLLDDARRAGTAVARPPSDADQIRIAIIGAGVAGLTAARELFRSGYTNIDIYEASGRIGGRTYTKTSSVSGDMTTFEMGAMRLPFFWPQGAGRSKAADGGRGSKNSVIDYFCDEFNITTQPFPNPGAAGFSTGIYINRGYGPPGPDDPAAKPKMIIWKELGGRPGNKDLDRIQKKWLAFKRKFQKACRNRYADKAKWQHDWQRIASEYRNLNFREFVVKKKGTTRLGNFGGLGMTERESELFKVIGMGDGGWGAFYDISCLYVLRIFMFGFADQLQLIQGCLTDRGSPDQDLNDLRDSLGEVLMPPRFLGVQALAESLLYKPSTTHDGKAKALYEAISEARGKPKGIHLYLGSAVRRMRRVAGHRIRVISVKKQDIYDNVIVTAMPWSLQVDALFEKFPPRDVLPWKVRSAMKASHFITSCKVFFPLKRAYWGPNSKIPQVIVTDTEHQGVYGIEASKESARAVLLASYTWEDDAVKLLADDDAALAKRIIGDLDRILRRCANIKKSISPFVIDDPKVMHWERTPEYRGCARLYRQRSWNSDYSLLTYNQRYGSKSHLYFAGEGYSLEGGWVEPALRSALDAVIHLIKNTDGTFGNEFQFRFYPRRSTALRPKSRTNRSSRRRVERRRTSPHVGRVSRRR
jgi:tryptophan 2-monooxygenase